MRPRSRRLIGKVFVALTAILFLGLPRASAQSSEAALDAAVLEVHDKQRNVGLSAAVWHKGRLAYVEKLGHADLENGAPVTRATRFGIASINKAFTARSGWSRPGTTASTKVAGAVLSNCWGIDSKNGEMIQLAGKIALLRAGSK